MYLMKLISSGLCDTSHPKYVEHFNPMLQNIIFSVIKTISLGPLEYMMTRIYSTLHKYGNTI